jgi:hypothetical protein
VNYTLIMKDRQMKFYILSVAEMYQRIYGGILLDNGRPQLRLVDRLAA